MVSSTELYFFPPPFLSGKGGGRKRKKNINDVAQKVTSCDSSDYLFLLTPTTRSLLCNNQGLGSPIYKKLMVLHCFDDMFSLIPKSNYQERLS